MNKKLVNVSVIIPTYNEQNYIDNTINSLLNNNNVSYSQKSKKMLKNNPVPANTHSEINYQESNNELNNNQ